MKKYLINYIYNNKNKIKILVVFILVGIICGIIFFNMLQVETKESILQDLKNTLDLSKENNFQKINIILNSSLTNILILIIIYISSLFIIAPYVLSLIGYVKGLSIGFYISSLLYLFGIKSGIVVILSIILLPNIIFLPIYIYTLINSINFHYIIFDKKLSLSFFIKELYNIIISISLIFLSIILEQSMCNIIINVWKSL